VDPFNVAPGVFVPALQAVDFVNPVPRRPSATKFPPHCNDFRHSGWTFVWVSVHGTALNKML